jgi:hypothetical protein
MIIRIRHRRGTAAEWTAANPTLAAGEMGMETDTRLAKIGDGTTAWTSLGYSVTHATALASAISGAEAETTPADGWLLPAVVSGALKKITWANIKAVFALASHTQAATTLTLTATDRIVGRASGGGGAAEEIGCTALARTILARETAALMREDLEIGASTAADRRHDWVAPNDYCATAPTGSAESAAVWTITRIIVAADGTVAVATATGVAWDDRVTASYS